jgi:flagellum-specific peptidoglycan hydrolase FlgJ
MWTLRQPYNGGYPLRLIQWTCDMLNGSVAAAKRLGCSAEAIVAQAALESGWGQYSIGNNVFGIKTAGVKPWTGKTREVVTREWSPVRGSYFITDSFRVYDKVQGSIDDHTDWLIENTRYANLIDTDDTISDDQYFQLLQADGYATDPNYAATLHDMKASVLLVERYLVQTPETL